MRVAVPGAAVVEVLVGLGPVVVGRGRRVTFELVEHAASRSGPSTPTTTTLRVVHRFRTA